MSAVDSFKTQLASDEAGPRRSSSNDNDEEKRVHEIEQHHHDQKKNYLVEWDGDDDPLDPRTFSSAKKWFYILTVSTGSCMVTATSSIYTPAYEQVRARFNIGLEVATLGLSLYVLGLSVGPMLFGPLSEFYGRKPIYVGATFTFLIWLIPCAVAPNIQTLLVTRFLNGFSGSAFLAVAAGTIVDMYKPPQLLIPMTVFSGGSFVGPFLGPLVGGFISSFTSWRWVFYVMMIWAFVILICVTVMQETFHPVLLARKAAAMRKSTGESEYHSASELARKQKTLSGALLTALYVPFQLLLDPMIVAISSYTALLQGILYLFFGAFPLVFSVNHGFTIWQVGLSFVGLLIGNFIACMCNPVWHKDWMKRIGKEKAKNPEYKPEPELRLPPVMWGGPIVTISLFWFAWTTFPWVHWIVPIIATIPFSVGFFFVFQGLFTYLPSAWPKYAASAMAINTTTRTISSAAFPLFTDQMYNKLGYQWASTLVAFLTLAMVPIPFVFFKYGKTLRSKSKFASA